MKFNTSTQVADSTRRHKKPQRDNFFVVRNILNIIFMIGAVAGVLIYLFGNETLGTVVVLIAMVFKMAECTFRFFNF